MSLVSVAEAGATDANCASCCPCRTPIIALHMERLNAAAQLGDIGALYALIQEDAFLLKRIDEVPFVDTPLHIAASNGQICFAMEMVTLMPSYARKLNQDGFSPLHVAVENEKTDLILCLIEHDEDLIRVKGRNGMTPLHYAVAQENLHLYPLKENLDLLPKFLVACPQCIKDVTIHGETALHIALKKSNIEAFRVLMGWIRRSTNKDARDLEDLILNWKDNKGDTVLHIAARIGQAEAVGLLFPSLLDLNIKNKEKKTALQIAGEYNNEEIIEMLRWRAKSVFFLPSVHTLTKQLKSKISLFDVLIIHLCREIKSISSDTRDSLLVVFVLVATANFDAALSPPGGLWGGQLSTTDPRPSIFHESSRVLQSTIAEAAAPTQLGTIIMDPDSFYVIWWLNTVTLVTTFLLILLLFPSGTRWLLSLPLCLMVFCYAFSLSVISDIKHWSEILCVAFFSFIYVTTWAGTLKELRNRAFKREWGTSHIL